MPFNYPNSIKKNSSNAIQFQQKTAPEKSIKLIHRKNKMEWQKLVAKYAIVQLPHKVPQKKAIGVIRRKISTW